MLQFTNCEKLHTLGMGICDIFNNIVPYNGYNGKCYHQSKPLLLSLLPDQSSMGGKKTVAYMILWFLMSKQLYF